MPVRGMKTVRWLMLIVVAVVPEEHPLPSTDRNKGIITKLYGIAVLSIRCVFCPTIVVSLKPNVNTPSVLQCHALKRKGASANNRLWAMEEGRDKLRP